MKTQSEDRTSKAFRAYVSEPITRCPPREKGRIRSLVLKLEETLAKPPYQTRLYIPSLVTSPEVRGQMTAEHVYLLDRIRVVESDFMIVIADHTSFGIGGEVEMATSLGKPVIIFSRAEKLSRFLLGTPSNASRHFGLGDYLRYRDWRDLKPRLLPLVEKVLAELEPSRHSGIPFFDVGKQVRAVRKGRQMSIEDLAAKTGLRPGQLRLLEKPLEIMRRELKAYEAGDQAIDLGLIDFTPHQLEELANIGLPALHRLIVALEVPLATLLGENPGRESKGPQRIAASRKARLAEIRTHQLRLKAATYHISFREYQALEKLLIDTFLDQHPLAADRSLQVIDEKEFLDALAKVRVTPLH